MPIALDAMTTERWQLKIHTMNHVHGKRLKMYKIMLVSSYTCPRCATQVEAVEIFRKEELNVQSR